MEDTKWFAEVRKQLYEKWLVISGLQLHEVQTPLPFSLTAPAPAHLSPCSSLQSTFGLLTC